MLSVVSKAIKSRLKTLPERAAHGVGCSPCERFKMFTAVTWSWVSSRQTQFAGLLIWDRLYLQGNVNTNKAASETSFLLPSTVGAGLTCRCMAVQNLGVWARAQCTDRTKSERQSTHPFFSVCACACVCVGLRERKRDRVWRRGKHLDRQTLMLREKQTGSTPAPHLYPSRSWRDPL